MDSKNYTEVLIDGNIYTLGGDEDEGYMQRVASYINEKTAKLKKQPGFLKQSMDYQNVMIELNMADDYFKAQEQIDVLEKQRNEMEKETYSLKHELVSTQMKLESAQKEIIDRAEELEDLKLQIRQLKNQTGDVEDSSFTNVRNHGKK